MAGAHSAEISVVVVVVDVTDAMVTGRVTVLVAVVIPR